jgi:DNA polymerase III sliding clamp (beta) subunit (PCNA family)
MTTRQYEKQSAEDYMVPKKMTISIFGKILYQTKKGNIEWRALDSENYLADVGKCSLRVQKDLFSIYDSFDNLLETVKNSDLKRDQENVTTLFECARRSSLKVFEKLNELDKALDGIL